MDKEALKKLKDYEDAEEQGVLVRLPCKVGTDVWTIMCGLTGKHPIVFRQEFTLSMLPHFGTAVFLTREEAEAELAEEREEDGSVKYKNAASNAQFWRETIEELEGIRKKIDEI